MATACFCGCGNPVPFGFLGRRRTANLLGRQVDNHLRLFRGAVDRPDQAAHHAELADLVATGDAVREAVRGLVHGTLDRRDHDRNATREWVRRAHAQRGRMVNEVAKADYAGWNAHKQSELVFTGRQAPGVVVAIKDTGMTVNDDPRVKVRIRVTPEGEPPFEVERKVVVSRISVPRRGDHVEVVYDPADPQERFTFRMGDLPDGV